MKSLEHIIREIREGKTEKGDKKTLEGSIRSVMRRESSFAAKDSKPVDEGTDHSVYHVSWGPGLDHEVVARHGEEAVSKAKDALVAKTSKLKDPKYADTFNKKPVVHNISKERNVQKEDIGGIIGSGTGGEPKLHAEDGKKKKKVDEQITEMKSSVVASWPLSKNIEDTRSTTGKDFESKLYHAASVAGQAFSNIKNRISPPEKPNMNPKAEPITSPYGGKAIAAKYGGSTGTGVQKDNEMSIKNQGTAVNDLFTQTPTPWRERKTATTPSNMSYTPTPGSGTSTPTTPKEKPIVEPDEVVHALDNSGIFRRRIKESVGTLGTDKYQGNEFKSIRTATPHIKPPGPEHGHSQAPENASRQRSIAKEKAGINRVTEDDQLDEYAVTPEVTKQIIKKTAPSLLSRGTAAAIGGPLAVGAAIGGTASDVLGSLATGTETGRAIGKKIGELIYGKPETKSFDKTKETKPGTAPETRPKPKETEPEVAPKPKVAPGTVPAPDTKPSPSETPKTKPEPVKEPSKETKPQVVLPQVAPETATAPDTKAETKPKGETDKKTEVTEPAKGKDFSLPFLGAGSIATDTMYHKDHLYRPHESRGHAKSHRKLKEEVADKIRRKIENMPRKDAGDRKTIQYVGRPDAEPKTAKEKTSRLATIKNVIDEAKKVKYEAESGKEKKYVYPNGTEVVIGPDMKRNFLDVEDKKLPKDYDNK